MLDRSKTAISSDLAYPVKPNRYSILSWNYNAQECFTEEELTFLKIIEEKFQGLPSAKENSKNPFAIDVKTAWKGMWECSTPSTLSNSASYTLPNREAKDSSQYPFWNFAENMARLIANWQRRRTKNQDPRLTNDLVMMVLEEFKTWLFYHLAEKECRVEFKSEIAQRQNYLINILHSIPNFGLDRLFLHDLQNKLQQGAHIIDQCIANKKLPEMLSDNIRITESVAKLIGALLHSMTNQEIDPNFSLLEHTDPTSPNCYLSPVCRVNQNAQSMVTTGITDPYLLKFTNFNKFFNLKNIFVSENKISAQLSFKNDLLRNINFPSFATETEKETYLQTIAALESLINVKKTLENFKEIQTSLGTLIFAANYVDATNLFVSNYLNLIEKSQALVNNLLIITSDWLAIILKKQPHKSSEFKNFEGNYIALTLFAKDSTVNNQLAEYCDKAKVSIRLYQDKMQELVSNLHSGQAAQDVGNAMQNLFSEINYLNSLLPAQLGDGTFQMEKNLAAQNGKSFPNSLPNPAEAPSQSDAKILEENYQYFSATQIEDTQTQFYNQTCNNDFLVALPSIDIEKVLFAAGKGAGNGFLRGSANVLTANLHSRGMSSLKANMLSRVYYYTPVFFMNFYTCYLRLEEEEHSAACLAALCTAIVDTCKLGAFEIALSTFSGYMDSACKVIAKSRPILGRGLQILNTISRFGLFAYANVDPDKSAPEISANIACNLGTQLAVEYVGNRIRR